MGEKLILLSTMWNPHKHVKSQRQIKLGMYVNLNEGEGVSVWDFKGTGSNSQEDDRKCLVSKCLLGHAETMEHRSFNRLC